MKSRIAVLVALVALAAAAERQPLERYQSIIDRQMFGELPNDFDPSKMPSEVQKSSSKSAKELSAEQEKLKSAIHFSVINVRGDGRIEVGFTDNSNPKEPQHYFICEGETAGGWTVEEADRETATMTISKDGVSLELKLGDNSAKGGGSMKRTGEASGASAGSAARNSPLLGNGAGGFISARRRREQREAEREAEDRKRREEEERKRAEERAADAEREEQRAAEREEQRKQLLAIQEELRRVRESKAAEKAKEEESADNEAE